MRGFLAYLVVLFLGIGGGVGVAHACNNPNPNLLAPPFVDGCDIPAVALNKLLSGSPPVSILDTKTGAITPGVNNTPSFSVASSSAFTGYQILNFVFSNSGSQTAYDVLQGVAILNSGSTVQGANGVAGYGMTDVAGGNFVSVGIMGVQLVDIDLGVGWASDFAVGDNRGHVNSTHGTRTGYATELDCDMTSALSVCTGAFIEGNTTRNIAASTGVTVGYLDFNNNGSVAQWANAMFTFNGCCITGIDLGAQTATGTSASQPLDFTNLNSGTPAVGSVQLLANGILNFSPELKAPGFLAHAGTNKNTLINSNVDLASGTAISSQNDAANTAQPLEILASVTFFNAPIQYTNLTVAQLTAQFPCSATYKNAIAGVSDATSPTYHGTLTGGSTVQTLALCNGTSWIAN